MSSEDKRIDPADGQAYTYEQISEYYAGRYKRKDIEAYWKKCRLVAVSKDRTRSAKDAKHHGEPKKKDAAEAQGARGKALLRMHTNPGLCRAGSGLTPGGLGASCVARPGLHRQQTLDGEGHPLGRVMSVRAQSAERKHDRDRHHEDRAGSVPPAPARVRRDEHEVAPAKQAPKPALNRAMSIEVRDALAPAKKALESDVRRQLRLVVGGLMGSGKSTLCRMLADLLDGLWVNQDEFSHLKKGAKKAFIAEIANVSQDKSVPVLIVDKINTMQQHRREILDAMQQGVNGDVVFVQIAHPSDPPNSLKNTVDLCLSRIRKRGQGHRTLMGNDPKLEKILKMTAAGLEPIEGSELRRFSARFRVDMTLPPIKGVLQLLADLDQEDLLGRFHVEDLLSEKRVEQSFRVTLAAEKALARGQNGDARDTKVPSEVWIYVVDFDAAAQAALKGLWKERASQAPELELQSEFHVTLLYVGGRTDKQIAGRQRQLKNSGAVSRLRKKLREAEGTQLQLEVTSVVWDGSIAAAEVRGLDDFCANAHAHVTLAPKRGVPPATSNLLLARRTANSNLKHGLGEWLMQLGLAKYEEAALEWCSSSGVTSANEMVAKAATVAAALEPKDLDQRARIKTALATAATREVTEHVLQGPLTLRGKVHGRQRGE